MSASIQVDNICPFGLLVSVRHPYRLNFVIRVQLAFVISVKRNLLVCCLSFASLKVPLWNRCSFRKFRRPWFSNLATENVLLGLSVCWCL